MGDLGGGDDGVEDLSAAADDVEGAGPGEAAEAGAEPGGVVAGEGVHDDEGRVAGGEPEALGEDERGVAEAPGGGDEAAVALEGVGGAAAGGEELDGDRPLGLDVPGAIDLPDAAAAERLAELIAAGDDRAWAMLLRARQASP